MFNWWKQHQAAARLAEANAVGLIEQFGQQAYEVARTRARQDRQAVVLDGNRPKAHWNRVRVLIGRKTNRQHVDTATRYLAKPL